MLFFFNDTATTEIYTLSLHDALPIFPQLGAKFGFGEYRLDGYINLGRSFSSNVTNTFAIHPTVTRVNGSRTTKAGLDMRWIQYSTQNSGDVFRLNDTPSSPHQLSNPPT